MISTGIIIAPTKAVGVREARAGQAVPGRAAAAAGGRERQPHAAARGREPGGRGTGSGSNDGYLYLL